MHFIGKSRGVQHVPHGSLRNNGLFAESTLLESAYPYWQKKDRKPKRWQQQLQVELQTLAASVLCLQNVDGDLFQVHRAQTSASVSISSARGAWQSLHLQKEQHHRCCMDTCRVC
jgi:hypothetical protein